MLNNNLSALTLGELLAHSDPAIRRHATGALKALERHAQRLYAEQDARLGIETKDEDKRCAYCNEPMFGLVRIHHHTEKIDGKEVDVTK